MTDKPTSPAAMGTAFSTWWAETGQYLDPDASDVPWFDKRENLCGEAFMAGAATETARANAAEATIKALREVVTAAEEVVRRYAEFPDAAEEESLNAFIAETTGVGALRGALEQFNAPGCLETPNDKED